MLGGKRRWGGVAGRFGRGNFGVASSEGKVGIGGLSSCRVATTEYDMKAETIRTACGYMKR